MITDLLKRCGVRYFHIPNKRWALKLVKRFVKVHRVMGRGRNYKQLWLDGVSKRYMGHDGCVPRKYATYLYISIK